MAFASDSIIAPTPRLLRAAGSCRVLTTDDVLALMEVGPSIGIGARINGPGPVLTVLPDTNRHARVLREYNASVFPSVLKTFVAGIHLRRHRRFSRSVQLTPVRLRS